MKRLLLIFIAISIIANIYGQAPEGFNYQAVARNSQGQPIINTQVTILIAIHKGTIDGTIVYSESFIPTTNNFGLVNLLIGNGIVVSGSFKDIDWGADKYFINVWLNGEGIGTSQLLSVPYALYAKTAENGFTGDYNDLQNKPIGINIGDLLYWNGNTWVVLPIGQTGQFLQVNGSNLPVWSGLTSTLSTISVSSISGSSASTGGNITNDGGFSVIERGVCWNTLPNPTIADNKTSDGTGKGTYVSSISGLNEGTTFYIRAYATNSMGNSYGNEISFKTLSLPIVLTTQITSITNSSATTGGNVTNDGGNSNTVRGVCWNTSGGPTINDNKITSGNGTGQFTSSISGLSLGTLYYLRAYATNNVGTVYGEELNFTTTSIVLPTITTIILTSITDTSLSSGGNITSDGGSTVTAKGVCWSTTSNPTIAKSKTNDGNDIGEYVSSLMGLVANTTYYIRAYATNSIGTEYGNQIVIKTLSKIPTLITQEASISVSGTIVNCGGMFSDNPSVNVTEKGICWKTSSNPTINDSKTSDGTGLNNYYSTINDLSLDSAYYVRAYAICDNRIVYGNEISFTALRIGQTYQGGLIAYILNPSDLGYEATMTHGLIITPSNLGTNYMWFNGSYFLIGTSNNLGMGSLNTNQIVFNQGVGSYAAKVCYDLVLDGYSDWYLPSLEELRKLYINRTALNGLTGTFWSSTESSSSKSSYFNVESNYTNTYTKESLVPVRAFRSF